MKSGKGMRYQKVVLCAAIFCASLCNIGNGKDLSPFPGKDELLVAYPDVFECETVSLPMKVGQMLVMHFNGEEVNDDARTLIDEAYVGGIIYFSWANGLEKREQVRCLSEGLQRYAAEQGFPPLLICVDQEGGRVQRLRGEFTDFPSNEDVAKMHNPETAESVALALGRELRDVGIMMNLAPVVDINNNPLNPIINDRSFGNDPEIVTLFGARALEGYHRAGVATTLKHFPGHGDVTVDSHVGLPVIYKSREELDCMELVPFRNLAHKTDAIMTAHILIPALDGDNCATLSEKILNGILRDECGFKGVIMSDSLVMQGVLEQCGGDSAEAAIRAIVAGCDLLCIGGRSMLQGEQNASELTVDDIIALHRKIVVAVEEGRIPEERIDDSFRRIQRLKMYYH